MFQRLKESFKESLSTILPIIGISGIKNEK